MACGAMLAGLKSSEVLTLLPLPRLDLRCRGVLDAVDTVVVCCAFETTSIADQSRLKTEIDRCLIFGKAARHSKHICGNMTS